MVRVIPDEEGSCSVPVWITSTGLLFDGSAQILQEGMIGAVFDVGRVSRFQCGLLHENFSSIVLRRYYKRRGFVQSWERVSLFQCGFYIGTTSLLFCTDVTSNKRRKCREEGFKLSSFLEPLFG